MAGERRLVEFTGETRLWDNHNHLVSEMQVAPLSTWDSTRQITDQMFL